MQNLNQILNFKDGMKKISITPSIAAIMLEGNVDYNRQKNEKSKMQLSIQMQKGQWKEDVNSTIGFSKNNILLDGQHRLEAIIHSGCTISMWVCNNVSEDSFDVIDSGKIRSPGDVFSINGVEKGDKTAAATILLYYLNIKSNFIPLGGQNNTFKNLTHHCLYEYYTNRFEFLGVIDYGLRAKGLANSIFHATWAYLLQFENEEIVNDFFYKLRTGSDLYVGHPIMVFRDQITKFANKPAKERPTKAEYIARLLKAFNLYNKANIKPCVRIGWNSVSKESFPFHKNHNKDDFKFDCK